MSRENVEIMRQLTLASGVGVEMPEYGWVVTVRDSKIVEATIYLDKLEALEAVGLSE